MSITHRVFPKTIYQEDDILIDELNFYKSFILGKLNEVGTSQNELLHTPSTHTTCDRFYDFVELKPLVKIIGNHVIKYLHELGYSDEDISDLQMTSMWANYSDRGSFIYPHIHRDSFISGAFYIESTPEDDIKFFNNPLEIMGRRPSNFNELSYEYITIPCQPGRLLLFNSNLMHGTTIQKSEKKLTISFNIR